VDTGSKRPAKSVVLGFLRRHPIILSLTPVVVLMIGMYIIPLIILLGVSFEKFVPGSFVPEPVFTLENYNRAFSPVYMKVLTDTLWVSAVTAVLTVILAYPLAFYVVRSQSVTRKIVMAFLITSFFVQLIVRIYAFLHVFGDGGVLNQLLLFLGFHKVQWLGGWWPIIISMVHQGIPLAILVQMGSIKAINPELENAARILGANDTTTFRRITLPLSLPGIIASAVLSFTGAASAFVTPLLLGGGRVWMVANYVYVRFTDVLNYPFGSAMSVLLLVLSLVAAYGTTALLSRYVKIK
jgi:ABC-type spermidine/putrescine transport system permease subunit I